MRVLLTLHGTWLVNSATHILGFRDFETKDESRNNWLVAILAMGEGWHNNHHAFPTSARHGLRWWEFDGSYVIVRMMGLIGLASDIKVPDRHTIEAKLHAG